MAFINLDGLICLDDETLLMAKNRAFRSGEGLIETMSWREGKLRLAALHFSRLARGLDLLGFSGITEQQFLQETAKALSANNDPEKATVRVQFFRNGGTDTTHYLIEVFPLADQPEPLPQKGLRLGITRKVVKCPDSMAQLKTSSRLQYTLARRDAERQGWDDALLLNPEGRVVESTISNVFVVKGKQIFTPPLREGCIDGVMRRYLLEAARTKGFDISEVRIGTEMLPDADELFLTNAVKGIRPVHILMDKEYTNELTRSLMASIQYSCL